MTLKLRFHAVAVLQFVWAVSAGSSWAQIVDINNGLAPPNPANVIADDSYVELSVNNVGNVLSGDPTTVELVNGGSLLELDVRGSSTFLMSGGWAWSVSAADASHLKMTSGAAGGHLAVSGDATGVMSGGLNGDNGVHATGNGSLTITGSAAIDKAVEVGGASRLVVRGGAAGGTSPYSGVQVYGAARANIFGGFLRTVGARESSVITIYGEEFSVDGSPYPFGLISAQTGTLTGLLDSGESISATFYHGGFELDPLSTFTGSIYLSSAARTMTFYTDETVWRAAVSGGEVDSLETTAANLALADELNSPPVQNQAMGAQLMFREANTGLCGSFALSTVEPGAQLVYEDGEPSPSIFPPDTISIGDIGNFQDDDFRLTFPTESYYAVGFYLVSDDGEPYTTGNLSIFGSAGLIGIVGSYRFVGPDGFFGVVSSEPIVSIHLNRSVGFSPPAGDVAIRDFRFGCAKEDSDADGLSNLVEERGGTDPGEPDSDADGLLDGYELGTGTFGSQRVASNLADGARSVIGADIDGDGDTDLFSASYTDDRIAWYENIDGAESFAAPQEISSLANHAEAVFASDLDGDGDLDVLSASSADGKIAWYENRDGAGEFGGQKVITTLAEEARSVSAADIDGDGDMDVLSASSGDDKIAWYENQFGVGTFGSQRVISSTAAGAYSVFAADVDGDGDVDVLSASRKDNKIAWYKNLDGAGTFGPQQVISTLADGARSVVAADMDGDGDLDVLSASGNDDKIAWYENLDGMGSFGPQVVISTLADGALSVFASDVDGDGDTDVLSASFGDDKIAWYENIDGAGSFGTQNVISNLADGARSVYATDIDGDGDADVLSASANDDKIACYEQVNVGDPLDSDTDDDGVPDGLEDSDADGLSNLGEQTAGTSALNPDSDGDGSSDGVEVAAATDPLDPLDFPPLSVPGLGPWAIGSLATILIGLGVSRTRRRAVGGADSGGEPKDERAKLRRRSDGLKKRIAGPHD